jgi:hypothetical protein
MLGVLTNDTDYAVPLDYLALVADGLHTCPDFHPLNSLKTFKRLSYIIILNISIRRNASPY